MNYNEITKNGINSIEQLLDAIDAAAEDEDGGKELEDRFLEWLEAIPKLRKQLPQPTKQTEPDDEEKFANLSSYREQLFREEPSLTRCIELFMKRAMELFPMRDIKWNARSS